MRRMAMRKLVGRNYARLRRAKGLTQEAMEERSGFSQQYISDLERGLRNPTVVTLDELAQALDVNHVELVTPDDQVCPLFMKIMLLVDVARGGRRILREKFRLSHRSSPEWRGCFWLVRVRPALAREIWRGRGRNGFRDGLKSEREVFRARHGDFHHDPG